MNLTTYTEIIRIAANEPITLACSALADFLWEDFVRDSRPLVTYLIDHYKVKQLSRFGKELFERLYSADNVNWLVSEEAYETYFRKVCDGDVTAIPEGYKPENGIWYSIMSDLSQAAAWPELLKRSVGDQFNAGNNSVNILNELSNVIVEAIERGQFNVDVLTASKSALDQLRQQYQEALNNGDKKKADQLRKEGKALGEAINEAIQNVKDKIQSNSHRIIDNTIKEHDKTNEALNTLHGEQKGTGTHKPDLEAKKDLAKKIRNNKELKMLIKKLGALRKIWIERKKARKAKDKYEAITGACFDADVTKAFPAEIALAATPEGKALFALKYAQKTLLTKDYTSHRKDIGKGPIVMYIDVSGSMSGEAELWSKAIAIVIAEEALKENREVQIHLFDTRIDSSVCLDSNRKNNSELLDFVCTWSLGGGTSFNAVLAHALDRARINEKADILMITDGNSEVHDNYIKRLNKFKQDTGIQWNTVCINAVVPAICKNFSDEIFSVDLSDQDNAVDSIQRCIR
jgi:uncharacterized protein with von Willebrand factor type A (vWA) domain